MSNSWWRAYNEAVDDPKLILLSDRQFRAWFNLCCITSQNGGTLPHIKVIAIKLRVTLAKATEIVSELAALGLVDLGLAQGVPATMHNWRGRQYESDRDPTAASRSKRYRDRKRDVTPSVTPSVTRDATDASHTRHAVQTTEADTELPSVEANASPSGSGRAARATRLALDWQPTDADLKFAGELGLRLHEIDNEAAKFRDYWTAKSRDGAKRDWSATWRNWIRKFKDWHPVGGPNGAGNPTMEAFDRLAERAEGDGDRGAEIHDITPGRH